MLWFNVKLLSCRRKGPFSVLYCASFISFNWMWCTIIHEIDVWCTECRLFRILWILQFSQMLCALAKMPKCTKMEHKWNQNKCNMNKRICISFTGPILMRSCLYCMGFFFCLYRRNGLISTYQAISLANRLSLKYVALWITGSCNIG